jgi:hypothetical protein
MKQRIRCRWFKASRKRPADQVQRDRTRFPDSAASMADRLCRIWPKAPRTVYRTFVSSPAIIATRSIKRGLTGSWRVPWADSAEQRTIIWRPIQDKRQIAAAWLRVAFADRASRMIASERVCTSDRGVTGFNHRPAKSSRRMLTSVKSNNRRLSP